MVSVDEIQNKYLFSHHYHLLQMIYFFLELQMIILDVMDKNGVLFCD